MERENHNKYDPSPMAVFRTLSSNRVKENIGHIPIELLSVLCFFVKHGGSVSASVQQATYHASNLEQGGLEVPVIIHCSINSGKAKIMDGLKELLKKHWRDPRDQKDNPLYSTRKKARLMDSWPEEKLT